MKKIIFVIVFLVSVNFLVKAQEKTTIGIFPFTYAAGSVTNPNNVYSIQEAVINGFVKTRRFTIVDRTKQQQAKKEKEDNKSEDFIDSKKLAEQGKSMGAEFIVVGHVISASVEEFRSTDEGKVSVSYEATIATNLQIIDVETGQISEAEMIKSSSDKRLFDIFLTSRTPEAALATAIKTIDKSIDKFVADRFPIEFHISEIQEKDGKGNATQVLIAGGSAFGIKKGDYFSVVEMVDANMGGKMVKRKKEIGKIKVTKVEDENFSICDVKEGGIEINAKFAAKATLKVITKD